FPGRFEEGDDHQLCAVVEDSVRRLIPVQLEREEAGFRVQQVRNPFRRMGGARTRKKEASANGRAGGQRKGRFGAAFLDSEFRHVSGDIGRACPSRYIFSSWRTVMGFTPTETIWFNGKLVPWGDAKVHVLAHGLQYGTGVFEGMKSYPTADGPAIF